MSNESLQAIIRHAEIVNAAIPDEMPGSGPIRLHLTEIIAEAGAMVESRKALNNDGTIMTAPDTDHVAAIRAAMDMILVGATWGSATPEERKGLMAQHTIITDHADALQRELQEARHKIELLEWMAYQRKQRPEWSDEEILGRIPYLPEWRKLESEVQS